MRKNIIDFYYQIKNEPICTIYVGDLYVPNIMAMYMCQIYWPAVASKTENMDPIGRFGYKNMKFDTNYIIQSIHELFGIIQYSPE